MSKKKINQDILVSLIFTGTSILSIIAFSIYGLFSTLETYSALILRYALPLSLLSIFFSRTAVHKGIDNYNQKLIDRSFFTAIMTSVIAVIILIISAIII